MAFALATINGSDYFPHTDGESKIHVTFAMGMAFAFLLKAPDCVVMLSTGWIQCEVLITLPILSF